MERRKVEPNPPQPWLMLIPCLRFRPVTIFFLSFLIWTTTTLKNSMLAKLYKKKAHFVDMDTDCKCKHNEQVNPSLVSVKRKNLSDVKGTFALARLSLRRHSVPARAPHLHQEKVWGAHRGPPLAPAEKAGSNSKR